MSGAVDVLAAIDMAIGTLSEDGYDDSEIMSIIESRAAVAELIEAGRALQDAMDEHEINRFDIGPSKRFVEADERHRAALARVQGGES